MVPYSYLLNENEKICVPLKNRFFALGFSVSDPDSLTVDPVPDPCFLVHPVPDRVSRTRSRFDYRKLKNWTSEEKKSFFSLQKIRNFIPRPI
jgi:hypothetical protein